MSHSISTSPTSLLDLMRVGPRAAPVTVAFILGNVGVFLLMLFFGAGWWHTPNGVQLAWGANFGPATQDGQWWRLGSALFIHFGVIHLALNMWALWDVGRLVERLYGGWRFAVLFLGSGLLGNVLSLVVQGNEAVSGGASGAVFSLYGALLVFLWRERKQVERGEFRWLFGAALVFSVLMLGLGFVIKGIDNAAHGGGLVAGALWAGVLARPWTARSPRVRGARVGGAAGLLAVLTVLGLNMPTPSYHYTDEVKAREAIAAFLTEDQRVSRTLGSLLQSGSQQGQSFDALAGRIETDVAAAYEKSFEQLRAATPGEPVPSAATLETLSAYAALRVEASRDLAEGLREHDQEKIRKALQQAQNASQLATAAQQKSPQPSKAAKASKAPKERQASRATPQPP